MKQLEDGLSNKEILIEKLKSNNDELAKIIHKDNKLIPAMELSVRETLNNIDITDATDRKKLESTLHHLEEISKERNGILAGYETTNFTLPTTHIPSIDTMLRYLNLRAKKLNIEFNCTVHGNFKNIINSDIDEKDVNTLIADLCENAINATKYQSNGNVFIILALVNGIYRLEFFDNAPPFDKNVIENMGLKPYTTRKNDGGSGIGLMTTFELINKYKASFILDECLDSSTYTKRIAILFDHKNIIKKSH